MDLMMSDIFWRYCFLPPELTAANFGKVKNDANDFNVRRPLARIRTWRPGYFALTNDTARDIV
ncbi:MAG: hypothetical protein ACLS70_09195 [[Clostridium] symbiosum]